MFKQKRVVDWRKKHMSEDFFLMTPEFMIHRAMNGFHMLSDMKGKIVEHSIGLKRLHFVPQ